MYAREWVAAEEFPDAGQAEIIGRVELSRFDAPAIVSDLRTAPVNSLGCLRVMFAVDDLDDTLARLGTLGARVVDEVVRYENISRLLSHRRGGELDSCPTVRWGRWNPASGSC